MACHDVESDDAAVHTLLDTVSRLSDGVGQVQVAGLEDEPLLKIPA
jgi:hypothetical protein